VARPPGRRWPPWVAGTWCNRAARGGTVAPVF
jgi:hypothetical protein